MMFRNHMDPDYYDPKANDKIFVPDVPQNVSSIVNIRVNDYGYIMHLFYL